ncbi:MAG: YabP/YqfC family sporulation protein [Acutalibacteraceae bacterium]|nr:YabP/YqfC family sporulation protein [Acutalibacteraceae bacterium]
MKKLESISSYISDGRLCDNRIEIFGRSSLVVEGCYGIKEYSDEVIQINLSKLTLVVVGSSLEISRMAEEIITIKGKIISLEFEG